MWSNYVLLVLSHIFIIAVPFTLEACCARQDRPDCFIYFCHVLWLLIKRDSLPDWHIIVLKLARVELLVVGSL